MPSYQLHSTVLPHHLSLFLLPTTYTQLTYADFYFYTALENTLKHMPNLLDNLISHSEETVVQCGGFAQHCQVAEGETRISVLITELATDKICNK